MDPQKNATNSTPFDEGQALSSQDGAQQPAVPPQPQDGGQEVTVNFNQDQGIPQATRPGGLGNMPSITPDPSQQQAGVQSPAASQPGFDQSSSAGFGQPAPAAPLQFDPTAPVAPGAQPPLQPQDPYGPAAPAPQPGQPFPPAIDPAAQSPAVSTPEQPQFGQTDPAQQSAVPPVAPVPGVKADKKTIIILAAVAVVLVTAIAVLIFV
jgi:hypothetical protein